MMAMNGIFRENCPEHLFLKGRRFNVLSHYSTFMSPALSHNFFTACTTVPSDTLASP
ncbi:MAG: hypothetical protein A4E42_02367 [Methanoregulaceae archaeon PtaU1.Bin222]|nr:MAG: hypothetical protein A4E42_02367 [Methanoregulaceae archaeon PtaU1.Bin222]